jgi:SAM-dependent methyltransferase
MIETREPISFEEKMYPESAAGGFSHRCCTVASYSRVNALLLNLGAGRGANIAEDMSAYRRMLQTFRGRVARVIGLDLGPVVLDNPDLDEAHVIEIGKRYPLADEFEDVIVSDHVLEHAANPGKFAVEINCILKPGGWFLARTPVRWGYVGLGARIVPNSLHTRFLEKLQPERKAEDVFPLVYRMNTRGALRKVFPADRWHHYTYGFNGDPGYHANNHVLFRLVEIWGWLMPRWLSAKFHVALPKAPSVARDV